MRHVAQYIKYLQSSICTHRIVYSHILIHRIISAFGVFINTLQVPDHIPWDWSALRGVNRCGRPKQATSCCGDRSDISCWRSRSCCVTLYRTTVVGRGTDARRVAVRRTIMGCDEYVAPNKSNSKESHLTCSKLIQF